MEAPRGCSELGAVAGHSVVGRGFPEYREEGLRLLALQQQSETGPSYCLGTPVLQAGGILCPLGSRADVHPTQCL